MRLTMENGAVIEGTPEEMAELARLTGSHGEIAEEVAATGDTQEYRVVDRDPKPGDKLRALKTRVDWTAGKIYECVRLDSNGDPRAVDDVGCVHFFRRDGRGINFEVVEEVPVEAAQPEPRLKVGEYAKVVDALDVNGDKRYDVTLGEIRVITMDDNSRFPFQAANVDGTGATWFRANALVRATPAEVDEAKRKQFAKGDKVRLVSGGGDWPLYGFENGETYEVTNNDREHDSGEFGKVIGIKTETGKSGFARPDQLEKVSAEIAETPKADRPQVGQFVKILADTEDLPKGAIAKITEDDEDDRPFYCELLDGSDYDYYRADQIEDIAEDVAKWAAIGRKPGEFRAGDLVRVIAGGPSFGHPVGAIGEVTKDDSSGSPRINVGGKLLYSNAELVTPVESRFDRVDAA